VTREYTIIALVSVVVVVLLELRWFRSGIFRTRSYWIAMAICYAFMIAVNGWLTKLSAPIVVYDERRTTGWRVPWDIPVEDYLFGFALLTLAMLCWDRAGARERARAQVP
jgi:lycopene cyclase domain-containing protein